ncbi:MAG: ferredoxin--NADP(+) reductase [Polyangiaceae bacterium UTPRO1]|jgi:ferredoxin--NADP+ reductase|nr:ferredoxin--NADP reductase [Myxococcales bacterium]OQY66309.1 MAG: ferredoxin--NADP(+) reductase [Polyangiaceae bacterium UTPRO1]
MSHLSQERVLSVHHWNERLFSFTTTRDSGLRFRSGQFLMMGIEVDGRPLLRAYSVASAHYEDHLEFYSIKVPNGPLTSRLARIRPGDAVYVSRKPTGTLVLANLLPGRRLYLLGTGTGLAPFMSLIHDPEVYELFDEVVVVHGVRTVSELGYSDYIRNDLPANELVGEEVRAKLRYYPTVTREPFENQGRITHLIGNGRLAADLGMPALAPDDDRVMICGSTAMLRDMASLLEERGFREGSSGDAGHYVIERAFVS